MLILLDVEGVETQIPYNRTDNVVAIKSMLGKKIYKNAILIELYDPEDYDNNNKLDNNSYIQDGKSKFKYIIKNENPNEIILKVAPNNLSIPNLLQVDRNQNLLDFKEKLQGLFKIDNPIAIFINDMKLNDLKSIDENHLLDEMEIKICRNEDIWVKLLVTDLVPSHEAIKISCHITETVAELKLKIFDRLKMANNSEIALFTDDKYLEQQEKRLIDYSICDGKLIFYVDLLRISRDDIKIQENKKFGTFAEICYGTILSTNKTIFLKKYNFKGKKIQNFKLLQNEIIALLKLKSENHPRFVQLEAMFERDSYFYIGLELMQSSLADIIPIIEEEDVIKFSVQILEALVYLHNQRIIYRNLKCSSVLLDNNDNVKLSNFHMSKYLMDCNEKMLIEGMAGSKPIEYNWAAVEMIEGPSYGIKADSWSFGATLIEMVTGEKPYSELPPPEVKSKILKEKTIIYENPGYVSPRIEKIISLCLLSEEHRPVAADLLKYFQ